MTAFTGDSVASPLVWAITIAVTVGVLFVDLVVIARRPHEPTMPEVSRHLVFFIGLAVLFGLALWFFAEPHELSPHPGPEFFAGYRTPVGQVVLAVLVSVYLGSLLLMRRKARQPYRPRILVGGGP